MIWDEIDSGHDFLAYTRVSKMLHGGGATEYFQKTKVSVKLMPRKSAAPQVTLLLLLYISTGSHSHRLTDHRQQPFDCLRDVLFTHSFIQHLLPVKG